MNNLKKSILAVLIIVIGTSLLLGVYLFSPPFQQTLKHSESVMSFLDRVGIYQKNGSVELYGTNLRQRNMGPISISHSILLPQEKHAYLLWMPDYTTASDADYLEVQLHQPLPRGSLQIGLITKDGRAYLFDSNLSWKDKFPAKIFFKKKTTLEMPELLQPALTHSPQSIALQQDTALHYYAALPRHLVKTLKQQTLNSHKIKIWFVAVHNAPNTAIDFDRIALVKRVSQPSTNQVTTLQGTVSGAIPANSFVSLLTEKNEHYQQPVSANGQFSFSGLKPNLPVSLRFHQNARDYYSVQGRWLLPQAPLVKTLIDLNPLYVNAEKHKVDPTQNHFITAKQPQQAALYGAFYEPHAPQIWNGGSDAVIQEYSSRVFTNNYGFVDRDRFLDNPDHCLRLAYLGSSHAVALQVKPYERYNMELESELGVKLGRCVEVIAAGRDNGDIGSNYPRVRDYALRFHPSAILVENSSSLLMQLHPKLLKEIVGWDAEHNALDGFYYDKSHHIQFRPMDNNYPLYTVKPTFPPYMPGVSFVDSLKVEPKFLPQVGHEAFQYLADITHYFIQHHPDQRFILVSGLDEAQCKGKCNYTVKSPQGETIAVGAKIFTKNFQLMCNKNHFTCISAAVAEGQNATEDTYLTFIYDGHYRQQGHQWLARQLADGLTPLFKTS